MFRVVNIVFSKFIQYNNPDDVKGVASIMKLVYCDESCHLPNDHEKFMVLGAMACDEKNKNRINKAIREIKVRHGFSSYYEIKWTKVSQSKLDFYYDLIDFYLSEEALQFRAVIASKSNLNHNKYNHGSHDDWYYKMYYLLLKPILGGEGEYLIYLDVKDTIGSKKVTTLKKILNKNRQAAVVEDIRLVDSTAIDLLQLADLFIGAIGYKNRNCHSQPNSSNAKQSLIDYLSKKTDLSLVNSTGLFHSKFNLFRWDGRSDE